MTIHLHRLTGCAPAPLANYLKALGILRLVAEQADQQARGWWNGDTFCLLTTLSKAELEGFFLDTYRPTPVFNPWGGRSGYYAGSSEKTARNALAAIERSTADRLSGFRAAIQVIRTIVDHGGGAKPESQEAQSAMISRIRMCLRGAGADWLDTVIADLGGSFQRPAILGTGGNEGSGSYTAAFLAATIECVVGQSWRDAISPSLWSTGSDRTSWDGSFQPPSLDGAKKPKRETVARPFRQFLPGGNGTPWDLLLAFEGSILIQSGVARRSSTDQHRFLSSPFYFSPLGMGAGSSSQMDEFVLNKGRKNAGRGEQWFPLWRTPTTFSEIRRLFAEGRCSAGRRTAKNPLDAARAICALGASRGIAAFVRFGYLQRDNLATHFAVPLGRIRVHGNSTARLIDDLAGWLDRIHRTARRKTAPARLNLAHRRLADAVFAALTHDYAPDRWQAILLAAADIEAMQATGTAIEAGPIPPLHPDWVAAVDDGSAEMRLALALGSAASRYTSTGRPIDSVRCHWLPLEAGTRRFKTAEKRLVNDPRVVASRRDEVRDLTALVERRLVEAGVNGQRRLPLVAAPGCGARLDDLARFLNGAVDPARVLGLARAFMAIKWDQWTSDQRPRASDCLDVPDEAWLVVRLSCLAFPLTRDRDIPADPQIVRLLCGGDGVRAIEVARLRLRSVSIRPPLQTALADAAAARRWAAALAFPIHRTTALHAAALLDPSMKGPLHV